MLRDDFEPEELPLPSETSVINRESPTQLLAAGEPYLGLQSDADPQIWPDTESNYVYDIGAPSKREPSISKTR